MGKPIDIAHETYIVALLARGDTYQEVQNHVLERFGRSVNKETIRAVKIRNKSNLVEIKQRALEKAEADSVAIKNRANSLINKKLNSDESSVALLTKAHQDYLEGIITLKEYMEFAKSIKTAGLQELVTVSKEMHSQSSDAPAKPSNPEDIARIRQAIEEGNEVTLSQIVFNKNDAQPQAPDSKPL